MKVSRGFFRTLFVLLSIIFLSLYTTGSGEFFTWTRLGVGILLGLTYGLFLIGIDLWCARYNLRTFAIAVVGLFIGYLMGQALVLILDAVIAITVLGLHPTLVEILKIAFFLFGTYLGVIITLRSSDQLYLSIPFVKFSPTAPKSRDLVIDASILGDARLVDFARSGLLDRRIVLPRFVVRDLYNLAEHPDEAVRTKARRSLDVVKQLEGTPRLHLRYHDTDFPDVRDSSQKLVRLARLVNGDILTACLEKMRDSEVDGVHVINIHDLSNSLKPLQQPGEYLNVKIQRPGKEPRQGVGYLEDGTMVVVNGGGEYIGRDLTVRVLSVKHTSSGRMVFCNLE